MPEELQGKQWGSQSKADELRVVAIRLFDGPTFR
ncbi:hypothetical protein SAMN05444000_12746 [Shimia gijangensis]|uniref:Uncharacterized protein n=1 Tax=Shimia gijangensis TaxID=1470563 RepID=A0A1M6S4N4_9RHOB|nr:hypothetical protein SAMN05444000_12746 [Shimia gijangensis]